MAIVITLAVVGGLLALDRTVLHIYYQDDSEPIPTRTPRPTATPDRSILTEPEVVGVVRDESMSEPIDYGPLGLARTHGEFADIQCRITVEATIESAQALTGYAEFSASYEGGGRWAVSTRCIAVQIGGGPTQRTNASAGEWSYLERTGQVIRTRQ